MPLPATCGLVTLLTDFGASDPYVGLVKGMVKRQHRRAEVLDLCHDVPAQDVAVAAYFAAAAIDRFPSGTIHVGVVDPGVGTDRRALAVLAHDCYWIAPDNGLLTRVLERAAHAEIRELQPDRLQLGRHAVSRTFWGRDVFGPVAGALAGGRYGFRALGPVIDDPMRLPAAAAGEHRVVLVDHFGNLLTDLSGDALDAKARIAIGDHVVPCVGTYAEADAGVPVALVNSYGDVEVAVRDGRAVDVLGLGVGTPVTRVDGEDQNS